MRSLSKPQSRRAGIALAALSAVIGSRCASAANFSATWKPNTTGSWEIGANWSTSPNYPNNTPSDTYSARIDDPNANVILNGSITINSGTLAQGTLRGSGTLNTNTFLWSGGNLNGTGVINVATTAFLQNNTKALHGFTINFAPTCVTDWTNGDIVSIEPEGGGFNNAGTFNDATDAGWFWNVTQTPVCNNLAGATYVKLSGTPGANKQVWAQFNNAGTVSVNSAELWLAGGGTSSGTFTVDADRTLFFSDFNEIFSAAGATITTLTSSSVVRSDGTVTFESLDGDANTDISGKLDSAFTVVNAGLAGEVRLNPGSRFNKSTIGDLIVKSGTLALDSGQSGGVVVKNLKFSGGEIGGDDARHVQNSFEWTGGVLSGATSTESQDSLTIDSGSNKTLLDHVLINKGSATWFDGSIELNDAQIDNVPGATWTAAGDDVARNDDPSTASTFHNTGTFRKSIGAGGVASTDFQDVVFNNDGIVQVQAGVLRLGGGGTHAGTFTLSANTALRLADATFGATPSPHAFLTGSRVMGSAATLDVTGTTSFQAGSVADIQKLLVTSALSSSGTINTSSASVSLGGSVAISGGTWTNTIPGGAITVGGPGTGQVSATSAARIVSDSTVVGSGAGSEGSVSIAGGSRLDVNSILDIGAGGTGTLTVDGSGSAVSTSTGRIATTVASSGTVTVQNGGTWTSTSSSVGLAGSGTLNVLLAGQVSGSAASVGVQAGARGSVLVSGSNSRWDNSGGLTIGESGTGSLSVSAGGVLTSADGFVGRLPGGVGTATVSSGSRWDMSGSLYVAGSATLAANSGAAGTVILNSGGTLSAPALTRVWNDGTFLYNAGTLVTGAIDLVGGGKMLLSSGTDKFINTGTLTIDTANGSVLDLNQCDARLSSTPKASVENFVRTARNNGAWNGGGITSTVAKINAVTGLGVLSGAEYVGLGNSSFDGVTVAATDVLVKYTWNGDANFDGRVTFDDYVKIDTGFNTHRTGWLNGDFNYDGAVNFDDYVLIDIAFNQQNGSLARAVDWISGDDRSGSGGMANGVAEVIEHFDQFGGTYGQAFLAAVPEPSTLILISMAAMSFKTRSRVRRKRSGMADCA